MFFITKKEMDSDLESVIKIRAKYRKEILSLVDNADKFKRSDLQNVATSIVKRIFEETVELVLK